MFGSTSPLVESQLVLLPENPVSRRLRPGEICDPELVSGGLLVMSSSELSALSVSSAYCNPPLILSLPLLHHHSNCLSHHHSSLPTPKSRQISCTSLSLSTPRNDCANPLTAPLSAHSACRGPLHPYMLSGVGLCSRAFGSPCQRAPSVEGAVGREVPGVGSVDRAVAGTGLLTISTTGHCARG